MKTAKNSLAVVILKGLIVGLLTSIAITLVNAIGSGLSVYLKTGLPERETAQIAMSIVWLFITTVVAVAVYARKSSHTHSD